MQATLDKDISTSAGVNRVTHLEPIQFHNQYVRTGTPVVMAGMTEAWKATREWGPAYFAKVGKTTRVSVKEFTAKGIVNTRQILADYCKFIERHGLDNDYSQPVSLPYCHDVPLFQLLPDLVKDVAPFPADYLPRWYGNQWWRYVQFFLGPAGTLTPLHFDCLLTHNLFFQIRGRKRFYLIRAEDMPYCYRRDWRWFDTNPEQPDFVRHPLFGRARVMEVVVGAGEILYIPPGVLHCVRSLDVSVSFNIDWHNRLSSARGVAALFRGMPPRNVRYNFVIMLGLWFGISPRLLFPFYKSYLNYIS